MFSTSTNNFAPPPPPPKIYGPALYVFIAQLVRACMAGHLPGHRFKSLPESLSIYPLFFFHFLPFLLNDFDEVKVWLSGLEHVYNWARALKLSMALLYMHL